MTKCTSIILSQYYFAASSHNSILLSNIKKAKVDFTRTLGICPLSHLICGPTITIALKNESKVSLCVYLPKSLDGT